MDEIEFKEEIELRLVTIAAHQKQLSVNELV